MVVDFLSQGFFCNAGTASRTVNWSVSGDPGGRVNIFRLQSTGSFVQIGSNVSFSSGLVDLPPGTGQYQYWVIAANSQNVDTVRKSPASGFFTFTSGSCIS